MRVVKGVRRALHRYGLSPLERSGRERSTYALERPAVRQRLRARAPPLCDLTRPRPVPLRDLPGHTVADEADLEPVAAGGHVIEIAHLLGLGELAIEHRLVEDDDA